MLIRPAHPSDFPAMWPIFQAVVASGSTYAFAPYYQYAADDTSWRLDNYLGGITVNYFASLRHIPVPEPGTLSLSLLGGLALARLRQRGAARRA